MKYIKTRNSNITNSPWKRQTQKRRRRNCGRAGKFGGEVVVHNNTSCVMTYVIIIIIRSCRDRRRWVINPRREVPRWRGEFYLDGAWRWCGGDAANWIGHLAAYLLRERRARITAWCTFLNRYYTYLVLVSLAARQ